MKYENVLITGGAGFIGVSPVITDEQLDYIQGIVNSFMDKQ